MFCTLSPLLRDCERVRGGGRKRLTPQQWEQAVKNCKRMKRKRTTRTTTTKKKSDEQNYKHVARDIVQWNVHTMWFNETQQVLTKIPCQPLVAVMALKPEKYTLINACITNAYFIPFMWMTLLLNFAIQIASHLLALFRVHFLCWFQHHFSHRCILHHKLKYKWTIWFFFFIKRCSLLSFTLLKPWTQSKCKTKRTKTNEEKTKTRR